MNKTMNEISAAHTGGDNTQSLTASEADKFQALKNELLFIELKDDVRERLQLPQRVPILKSDLQAEFKQGAIPPAAFAAGIEALKLLHPDIREYDAFLARYYLLEGRRGLDENNDYDAQRFYQKALDLNRDEASAEAAFYLAGLSAATAPAAAIDYYRRSIELQPTNAATHFELARLLRDRRDLQGALDELNKAAALEPESASVPNEIAETYLMANDYPAARAAFKQALAIEPGYWVLSVRLGMTEYELEDYPAAIKDLRKGLDESPDELNDGRDQDLYVEGLYYLAMSYKESGDALRANKLFRAVLNLAPDHPGALQALAS